MRNAAARRRLKQERSSGAKVHPMHRLAASLWRLTHLLTFLFSFCGQAQAAQQVELHIFWSRGCPHCESALSFLDPLTTQYPDLKLIRHELSEDPGNLPILIRLAERHGINEPGVPFMVLGNEVFVGYQDDATTGRMLKQKIEACLRSGCETRLDDLAVPAANSPVLRLPDSVRLPAWGMVDLRELSLPLLTVVLAAADGFNPCAMWVLVFLIGLLLQIQNRFRRWMLGLAFLAGSALVYFLIMVAWLNTLRYFSAVLWIRAGIAVVAIIAGVWALRDALRDQTVCRVTAAPARRAILERLRGLALSASLPLALLGIVLLAFAVNLVEFLCSAGIPAVYTQYLALKDLPLWQHYAYLSLYILVFLADDLLIFVGAMLALEIGGVGQRVGRWSRLIGGVVLLILGILLLFKPEWLM